jgi:hypothetical protein
VVAQIIFGEMERMPPKGSNMGETFIVRPLPKMATNFVMERRHELGQKCLHKKQKLARGPQFK